MLSAPAASSAATSSPRRAKSAGSTDGMIWIGRVTRRRLPVAWFAHVFPTLVLGVPRVVARGDGLAPVLGRRLARVRAQHAIGDAALRRWNGPTALEIEVPLLWSIAHAWRLPHHRPRQTGSG